MLQSVGKTVWVGAVRYQQRDCSLWFGPGLLLPVHGGHGGEAQRMGFSAEQARLLVQQTALGAAQMVVDNPQLELATLRAQVTSRGGTTAETIALLKKSGGWPTWSAPPCRPPTRAEEMETLF